MLILLRHGQTEANASGLLQGRADLPLTERGRAQAAAAAARLPAGAAVVCSPLRRARETAQIVAETLAAAVPSGPPAGVAGPAGSAPPATAVVTVDDRWIELDYGEWDGRPVRDVPAGEWAAWRDDIGFRPPGGESLSDLGRRVRGACEDLAVPAAAGDVIIVSHVSPIKAAVAWALGVGDETSWRMFMGVAGICRIAIGERGPSLHSYNESAHLSRFTPG